MCMISSVIGIKKEKENVTVKERIPKWSQVWKNKCGYQM